MFRYLSIIVLLFVSSKIMAEVDISEPLFMAFQNGCSSHGPMARTAREQTNALKEIIKSVQEDKDCKIWANQVSSLISDLNFSPINPQSRELNDLSSQMTALTEALANESNPLIADTLAMALADKKIESILMANSSQENLWSNRLTPINSFTNFTNQMNGTLKSNVGCFNKYPGLIMQVGGQILQSAGPLNLWGSVAGAGLTGLGALFNLLIDLIQGSRFARSMRKLKKTSLTSALSCSLETLSNTYCHAKNVRNRIDEVVQSNINLNHPNWRGLLLSDNIFNFTLWVQRVVSGTPSGNIAVAETKKKVIELRANYEKDLEEVNAILTDGERELNNSRTSDLESLTIQLLKILAKEFTPDKEDPKSSPYVNSFTRNYDCGPLYYFYSPTGDRNPKKPPFTRCQDFIDSQGFPVPSLSTIREKSKVLLDEGRIYVDFRFSLVKEIDPVLVLLEAERKVGQRKLSPLNFLKRTKTYLKKLKEKYHDQLTPHMGHTLVQTENLLQKALKIFYTPIIIEPENNFESKIIASKKLESIQDLIAPQMKSNFLAERLKPLISFEIRQKIKDHEIPEVIREFLLLSLGDEISNLEMYSGLNLEETKYDAAEAMKTSITNIEAIADVFKNPLKNIFLHLNKEIKKYPNEESIKIVKNRLCILTLTIPQINERRIRGFKFIKKNCQASEVRSIYNKKDIYIKFKDHSKGNYNQRACQYYDYMKRNDMYRYYGRGPRL